MIDITNGVRVFGVSFRAGVEAPALSNSDTWVRGYERPALPSGWFWMLDTVSIEKTHLCTHLQEQVQVASVTTGRHSGQLNGRQGKRQRSSILLAKLARAHGSSMLMSLSQEKDRH